MASFVTSTAGSNFPATMASYKGFIRSSSWDFSSLIRILSCALSCSPTGWFVWTSADTDEEEPVYSSMILIACSTSLSLWKSISRCTPSAPIWSNKGFSSSRVTQQAITLLPPASIFLYKSYHFGEPPCGSPTPGVHWMAFSSSISSKAGRWCIAPTPSRW